MFFPIRRWRSLITAAVMAMTLAALPQQTARAGLVTPADVEPAAVETEPSTELKGSALLPSPTVSADAQQFWYPGIGEGVEIDAIALSRVPVQTTGLDGPRTLAGAQQHPLIPLPGAAWTGMAGLLGLAAVKVARNFRRILA